MKILIKIIANKITISAIALTLVLRLVNFDLLITTIEQLNVTYVILTVFLYLFGQCLSSIKWWCIARNAGIDVTLATAFKAYFTGMFINILGVGTVGGDVTRGILITENRYPKTTGIASVVADRIHGLAVLATIGLLGISMFGALKLDPLYVKLLGLFAIAVISGWFIGPSLALKLLPKENKFYQKIEQVLKVFPKNLSTLLIITSISVIFHFTQIYIHMMMGKSMGIDLSLSYLIIACPFANIVSTLPISWQGLGVRENAYKFFFVSQGLLTNEQAITFGAIWFLSMTVSGCIGGIVLAFNKSLFKAES